MDFERNRMKSIDFLPEVYRQRQELRRNRIWWGIVMLIFSVAIGSTAAAQRYLRRSIQAEIDDLAPQFDEAQKQVHRLAQLQAENRTAGELAGLVTYLEQPWPRTRLLAEVVGPLPEAVGLRELFVTEDEVARPSEEDPSGPRRRNRPSEQQQMAKMSGALSDLETLRRIHDYRRPVIEISGTVADVAILHDYVARLGRSPLVTRAQIKSLESPPTVTLEQPTQFTLRLLFRPSHGQPDYDSLHPASPVRVAQGGTPP